jgi:hypothetical protein
MPFNGSGGFVPLPAPTFPAVDGTTILSDQLNLNLNDIFLGFANCVTRDGQSPATANLPMGGFTFTNLAAGGAAGEPLVFGQVVPFPVGTAALPSITFSGDPNTGIYSGGADILGFSTAGVERLTVLADGQWRFITPAGIPTGEALLDIDLGNTGKYGIRMHTSTATRTAGIQMAANGTTPGISSFDIFHSGTSSARLINRSNTNLEFWTGVGDGTGPTPARMIIGGAGNVLINSPDSGVAFVATGFAGSNVANFLGGASNSIISTQSTAASSVGVGIEAKNSVQTWQFGVGVGVGDSSWYLHDATRVAQPLKVTITGNVSIPAPSSGVGFSVAAFAGQNAAVFSGATDGEYLNVRQSVSAFSLGFGATATYTFINGSNGTDGLWLTTQGSANKRLGIGNNGNVTVNAPSSGTALTVNGAGELFRLNTSTARGGGNAYIQLFDPSGAKGFVGYGGANDDFYVSNGLNGRLLFYTNATEQFSVEADGRVYGRGLHNNGTVTGTTNQYLASGTYTPTVANVANTTARSGNSCRWTRVGNVVHVEGSIQITPTSGGSAFTAVSLTLPLASNLTSAQDLDGVGVAQVSGQIGGYFDGDTTNDVANYNFFATSFGSNIKHAVSFQYTIL